MISPDTTETISTISFTKFTSCRRQDTQTQLMQHTPFFLKDLISSLWLPVHTGKKRNSKTKTQNVLIQNSLRLLSQLMLPAASHCCKLVLYRSLFISAVYILYLYCIRVIKAQYETITAVSCFGHMSYL